MPDYSLESEHGLGVSRMNLVQANRTSITDTTADTDAGDDDAALEAEIKAEEDRIKELREAEKRKKEEAEKRKKEEEER